MFSIQPPIHQSLAQSQYGTRETAQYGTRETAQYGTRETAQYGTRETAQYGTINRDRLELKSSAKFIVLSIFIAFLLVFLFCLNKLLFYLFDMPSTDCLLEFTSTVMVLFHGGKK